MRIFLRYLFKIKVRSQAQFNIRPPPPKSPQGGAKIAQGGAKKSQALRARDMIFKILPPPEL